LQPIKESPTEVLSPQQQNQLSVEPLQQHSLNSPLSPEGPETLTGSYPESPVVPLPIRSQSSPSKPKNLSLFWNWDGVWQDPTNTNTNNSNDLLHKNSTTINLPMTPRTLDTRSTSVPLQYNLISGNTNNTSNAWSSPQTLEQSNLDTTFGRGIPQPFRSVSLPTIPYGTDFLNSSIWSNGYFGKTTTTNTSHSTATPSNISQNDMNNTGFSSYPKLHVNMSSQTNQTNTWRAHTDKYQQNGW